MRQNKTLTATLLTMDRYVPYDMYHTSGVESDTDGRSYIHYIPPQGI